MVAVVATPAATTVAAVAAKFVAAATLAAAIRVVVVDCLLVEVGATRAKLAGEMGAASAAK
jgi:hypothetical protein